MATVRSRTALALVVLLLSGCYTWGPYNIDPTPAAGEPLPRRLLVTGHEGHRIALSEPFIRSDTIFGQRDDGDSIAIPFSAIARVQRQSFSIERTLGLAIVPAAAVGLAYLIICGDRGCEPQY